MSWDCQEPWEELLHRDGTARGGRVEFFPHGTQDVDAGLRRLRRHSHAHIALLEETGAGFAELRDDLRRLAEAGELTLKSRDRIASYAEEIQIWTDVDGMMTTDPRVVADAWTVKNMSFAKASELAYFGAKVLFPLSVVPAIERNIPVMILNSRVPSGSGTRITREAHATSNPIKAIAVKRGITAITATSARMLVAYGFLRKLFEVFDRHRTAVDMVATSEVSVSLTLDNVQSLAAIVAERDADRAVRKLHQDSFSECDPAVFEPPHT
jgi:hypothetical protein